MIARAVFRCAASPQIGAGHVMRCLALAEAFSDAGWECQFVVNRDAVSSVPALSGSALGLCEFDKDADQVLAVHVASGGHADLLVVDDYSLDSEFESRCRAFAARLLVFDDATGRDHDCDVLIDAAAIDGSAYRGHIPAHASQLIGPKYATIGKTFLKWRTEALARRDGRAVKKILVSCGATDPTNLTALVMDSLADMRSHEISVVLSSRAPHLASIQSRLQQNMQLLVDCDDMAALMTRADFAIGAAGSTAFERCCLGLPSIIVSSANNQRGLAALLSSNGAAINAGHIDSALSERLHTALGRLLEDRQVRIALAQAAASLVDGRGSSRVLVALAGSIRTRFGRMISVRLAEGGDEAWLLKLQRQPATRRFANNPNVPSQAEHAGWMRRILADPNRLLMVLEDDASPVGMLRLDRMTSTACFETSVAVDEAKQSQGIGAAGLALARRIAPAADLVATVLPDNRPSLALFRAAGYIAEGDNRFRSRP